jgi:ubiquinone/menaquinone biosynthesis C-methylase UbiE
VKVRESGMPNEGVWESFFDPDLILRKLRLNDACTDVVEFGCGYGTFTFAAAKIATGTVYALDIEKPMLDMVSHKSEQVNLTNIEVLERDFVADGTGRADGSADYVMLFNILHTDDPITMLREARRILRPGGRAGVIHWNYDPLTPRGPPMAIRPRPDDCKQWAEQAGFQVSPVVDLPPYHYGFILSRPS